MEWAPCRRGYLPWEPPAETLAHGFGTPPRKEHGPRGGPITVTRASSASRCLRVTGTVVVVLVAGLAALVLFREYLGYFMLWLAHLPGWYGPVLFAALFIPVAFPFFWGYIVLNVGAGYLYGVYRGTLITAVGAAVGAIIAFVACRKFMREYVMERLKAYTNFRQIVRVIEGHGGFRIIMMTRLTPVPFGLQNALFSVARISKRKYIVSTVLGLLPTQVINAYMGSTLRSMEDVLAGRSGNTVVVLMQVAAALAVTVVVNQHMKRELSRVCHDDGDRGGLGGKPPRYGRSSSEPSAYGSEATSESDAPMLPPVLPPPRRQHSAQGGRRLTPPSPLPRTVEFRLTPLHEGAHARSVRAGPPKAGFTRSHRRTRSAGPILYTPDIVPFVVMPRGAPIARVPSVPSALDGTSAGGHLVL